MTVSDHAVDIVQHPVGLVNPARIVQILVVPLGIIELAPGGSSILALLIVSLTQLR